MSAIRVYFTNLKILTTDTEKAVFTRENGSSFSLSKNANVGPRDTADLIENGIRLINWEQVCFVAGAETEQREMYEE